MLKNNTYRRYAFIVAFILSLLIINVGMVTANPNQKNLEKQSNVTHNSAIINNGVIQLGVNDEGDLNVGGGTPSSGTGTTIVGLRYMPTKADAISPGCPCEGWGVADKTTQISGWANRDYGGAHGMTLVSFTSDSTSATSIVKISNTLQVTHFYHPSASPNLYQVDVSIKNIGSTPAELLYRRTMDWDVEPTAFDEFVTVNTGTANNIIFTSDDGFAYSNPLSGPSDIGHTGSFTDAGPDDHGALFDFNFGTLSPGETKEFKLFYGAAADESEAKAALATIGAEAYSLGKPNTPDGKTLGKPNTFIFAATGVGGTPIISSGPIANAGPDIVTRSGDNVYFTGSATGNIVEYNWNFGDGDGSNQKDPVHRFRGSPYGDKTYTITLTVKDEIGNIGKDTAYVTVKPLEKNLEVSNDPVPPTTKVYAKIKPIYNWVSAEKGYDEYVVNRIEYEYGGGFTGDISISIVSEVCAACGAPELDWDTDILTINKDKVAGTYYVASEGNLGSSHLSLYYDTSEGKFEGITVKDEDYSVLSMTGWAPTMKFSAIDTGNCVDEECFGKILMLVAPNVFKSNKIEYNPNPGSNPEYIIPLKTSFDVVHIASPGELRVYDSQNNITGLLNGAIKEDIPFSLYDNKTVIILNPSGNYVYEIKGTGTGNYGLYATHVNVTDFNATINFNAVNIPTAPGQDHQYTIDWDALSRGEKGVTLQIDYDGDGTFDRTIKAGANLSDITPPTINISIPIDGMKVLLNENMNTIYSVIDSQSGVATVNATVPNGTQIDTSTVGTKKFSVNATDNAGNQANKTVTYSVIYNYSGVLPPIKPDGSGTSKLGSTIPVKFQLWDANGNYIATATARIYLAKVTNGVAGNEIEGVSSGNANTGNLFRYDTTGNQYIFNLATKPLSAGTWQIRISLDNGTSKYANIGLK